MRKKRKRTSRSGKTMQGQSQMRKLTPNHVPPHVAGYIDELVDDRKKLAGALLDLVKADGSTRLMRVQVAKQLLMEMGFMP